MEASKVLKAGFAMLHDSEAFSDCKVICGPHSFNLHKTVLSSQSDYFMKAFNTETFKEGKTGIIKLKTTTDDSEHADDSCDDPEIVKLMIEYFYHFEYLRAAAETSDPKRPNAFFVEHAKVFAMAIKYQADGLRQLATKNFQRAASKYWKREDFAQAIHVVFTSTPDDVQELRSIVADTIHDHFTDLRDIPEIDVAVRSLAGLAYSILERKDSAWRRTQGHTGENLRRSYDCTMQQCAQRFDVCKDCIRSVPNRPSIACPFCKKSVPLA